MAEVMKRRRLVNPARRRKMTAKQIKHFGTRRQKAALRRSRGRRRNQSAGGIVSTAERAAQRAIQSVEHAAEDAISAVTHVVNRGRRRNVGEILTVLPANPGRRKNTGRRKNKVAATKRRRARASNRRANRSRNRARRSNVRHYRRHRNRTSNPRVIVRYRTRRHNRAHNRGRRRNPNFLSGDAGKVVSVLGGALVTSTLTGFLPSNLTTGPVGWLTTGVTAVVGGTVVGKIAKNPTLGNWFTVGGLVIVGLQIIQQFLPQLQLPFTTSAGTSGMGLITGSNFYVPQVNQPGSMASFYLPAAIPQPVAAAPAAGLGQYQRSMRRVGRLR